MKKERKTGTAPAKNSQEKLTFCMHMSAMMDSGMVRLRARVPMREEVRKQPQSQRNSESTVPMRPLMRM